MEGVATDTNSKIFNGQFPSYHLQYDCMAVYSPITHTNYELARVCVRAGDRNAGNEVTCFTLTHINYFTSQSFVCVSHRHHINQRQTTVFGILSSYCRSTDYGGHAKYRTTPTRLAFSPCISAATGHWHHTTPECTFCYYDTCYRLIFSGLCCNVVF